MNNSCKHYLDDGEDEGNEGEWLVGKKCPNGWIDTLFQGDLGYDVETAKTKCAAGCNARDDCRFADLFWVSSKQTCYLRSDKCGDYQNNEHWAYRVYIKN